MGAAHGTGSEFPQPFRVVIVATHRFEADYLDSVVGALGLRADIATTFHDAKLLIASRPDLLITELRLGQYNGLHLALRGNVLHPRMATIVTSRSSDTVLQRDAEAMGCTFVLMPTSAREFNAAILRTVDRRANGGVQPIHPPFERRRASRRSCSIADVESEGRAQRRRSIAQVLAGQGWGDPRLRP